MPGAWGCSRPHQRWQFFSAAGRGGKGVKQYGKTAASGGCTNHDGYSNGKGIGNEGGPCTPMEQTASDKKVSM